MTCAKVTVRAFLQGASGRYYMGRNTCGKPQQTCPRLPGEGYEKCKSVCEQECHAEIDALQQAGDDARGGIMWVDYHYICDDCTAALAAADVIVRVR